jgi:excisionase family DNA binding protein
MQASDSSRPPLFVSVRDAAAFLGVSPERLARALSKNQIPSILIGSRRLIARATLERLAQLDAKESA